MALESRNILIEGHRTSIRLEPEMWGALEDICCREGITVNDFCSRVNVSRGGTGLTAATRVYLLLYFREVASLSGDSSLPLGEKFWARAMIA